MKRFVILASLLLIPLAAAAEELAIGAAAPGFNLVNAVDGKSVRFEPGDGRIAVVVFTCNQCPYAKAFEERLSAIGREYAARGVAFYAVNPNDDRKYPEEGLGEMKSRAAQKKFPYPYLKDSGSAIARQYGARVTPHVYVVDGAGKLRYRGYVDDDAKADARSHSGLTDALDSLLEKKDVPTKATKAFGCTIKWTQPA